MQESEPRQNPAVRPPDHLTHEQLTDWCDGFMRNPEFVAWLRQGHARFGVSCIEVFDHLVVYSAKDEVAYEPR